jgi:hypothetical protein
MLSTLSTNIKVLIGISSFVIIGLIYYFIKNIFKSKQIQEKAYSTKSNKNSLKENNTQELKNISKNIKELHDTHKSNMKKISKYMDNIEQHHEFIIETYYNVFRGQKTIILDNTNTTINTNHEIVINASAVKNEIGFPYAIYSMVFVSADIPNSASDTPFVNLLVVDSGLQQFLGNYDILSVIPLKQGANYSHYTVANINHNIIKNPINVNTLKLKLLNPDGTIYGLPTNNYSITIEIVADRGNQVYGT